MIPMIGYDVTYHRGAFVVEGDKGNLEGMSYYRLDDAVEWAIKSVLGRSDGRWMIHKKRLGFQNDDIAAELVVVVPAGRDQREQLLAAVARFEEVVETRLGTPVDIAHRDIEDDDPRCEVCGQAPTWIRNIADQGDLYFCATHAEQEPSFSDRFAKHWFWKQLEAST